MNERVDDGSSVLYNSIDWEIGNLSPSASFNEVPEFANKQAHNKLNVHMTKSEQYFKIKNEHIQVIKTPLKDQKNNQIMELKEMIFDDGESSYNSQSNSDAKGNMQVSLQRRGFEEDKFEYISGGD